MRYIQLKVDKELAQMATDAITKLRRNKGEAVTEDTLVHDHSFLAALGGRVLAHEFWNECIAGHVAGVTVRYDPHATAESCMLSVEYSSMSET